MLVNFILNFFLLSRKGFLSLLIWCVSCIVLANGIDVEFKFSVEEFKSLVDRSKKNGSPKLGFCNKLEEKLSRGKEFEFVVEEISVIHSDLVGFSLLVLEGKTYKKAIIEFIYFYYDPQFNQVVVRYAVRPEEGECLYAITDAKSYQRALEQGLLKVSADLMLLSDGGSNDAEDNSGIGDDCNVTSFWHEKGLPILIQELFYQKRRLEVAWDDFLFLENELNKLNLHLFSDAYFRLRKLFDEIEEKLRSRELVDDLLHDYRELFLSLVNTHHLEHHFECDFIEDLKDEKNPYPCSRFLKNGWHIVSEEYDEDHFYEMVSLSFRIELVGGMCRQGKTSSGVRTYKLADLSMKEKGVLEGVLCEFNPDGEREKGAGRAKQFADFCGKPFVESDTIFDPASRHFERVSCLPSNDERRSERVSQVIRRLPWSQQSTARELRLRNGDRYMERFAAGKVQQKPAYDAAVGGFLAAKIFLGAANKKGQKKGGRKTCVGGPGKCGPHSGGPRKAKGHKKKPKRKMRV